MRKAIAVYGGIAHAFTAYAHLEENSMQALAHLIMAIALIIGAVEAFHGSLTASALSGMGYATIFVYMLKYMRKHTIVVVGMFGYMCKLVVQLIERYGANERLDGPLSYTRMAAYVALFAFYFEHKSSTRLRSMSHYLLAALYLILVLESGWKLYSMNYGALVEIP